MSFYIDQDDIEVTVVTGPGKTIHWLRVHFVDAPAHRDPIIYLTTEQLLKIRDAIDEWANQPAEQEQAA